MMHRSIQSVFTRSTGRVCASNQPASSSSSSSLRPHPRGIRSLTSSSTSNTSSSKLSPEKEEIFRQAAARKHSEMESVIHKPKISSSSSSAASTAAIEQARRKQFNQGLFNAGFSFLTVIFAAQALKSAQEKKRKQKELDEALQLVEAKRQLLVDLQSAEFLERVAKECVQENRPLQGGSWFQARRDDDAQDVGVVLAILQKHLARRIGAAALSEDERDRAELLEIAQTVGTKENQEEEALNMIVQEVEQKGGVVKKKVFAF